MAAIIAIDLLHRRKKMRNLKERKQSPITCAARTIKTNTHDNFMEICRMCLKKAEFPIFTGRSTVDKAGYIKMITNIEVTEGDHLPQKLCGKCNMLLLNLSMFKKRALKADAKLKKQMKILDKTEGIVFNKQMKVREKSEGSDSDTPLPTKKIMTRTKRKYKEIYQSDDHNNFDDCSVDSNDKTDKDVIDLVEYPCDKCTMMFSTLKDFILHRRTSHELWKVECPDCKNLFAKSYLEKHIASVHRKERPYVCEVCGIGFPYKAVLQTHQLTHNNDFPYKCTKCPYKSRTMSGLNVHLKLHSGVKPFSCEVCGARFISRALQKRHSYVHDTNYKFRCDKCDRGFHMRCQLRNHVEAIHEGRKDHECDICNKRFGFRKRMMKHRRQVHKLPSLPSGRTPKYLLVEQSEREKLKTSSMRQ